MKMLNLLNSLALGVLIFVCAPTFAQRSAESSWELRPAFGVGYNEAQGSYYSAGLSLQNWWNDSVLIGVGGYYSVGSPSVSTQGFGAGPFAAYFYPIADFLTAEIRQGVDYVSQRTPLDTNESEYTTENGVVSATSAGLHVRFSDYFGISGGYRYVLSLGDRDLDKGRSGMYLGLAVSL